MEPVRCKHYLCTVGRQAVLRNLTNGSVDTTLASEILAFEDDMTSERGVKFWIITVIRGENYPVVSSILVGHANSLLCFGEWRFW